MLSDEDLVEHYRRLVRENFWLSQLIAKMITFMFILVGIIGVLLWWILSQRT
jgi:hypothetical protein